MKRGCGVCIRFKNKNCPYFLGTDELSHNKAEAAFCL